MTDSKIIQYVQKAPAQVFAFQWDDKAGALDRFKKWMQEAGLDVDYWIPFEGTMQRDKNTKLQSVLFLMDPDGVSGTRTQWQSANPGDWVVRYINNGTGARALEIISDSMFKVLYTEQETRTPNQLLLEKVAEVEDDTGYSFTPESLTRMGVQIKQYCDTVARAIRKAQEGEKIYEPVSAKPEEVLANPTGATIHADGSFEQWAATPEHPEGGLTSDRPFAQCGLMAVHAHHNGRACAGMTGSQYFAVWGKQPGHNMSGLHSLPCGSTLAHLGHNHTTGPTDTWHCYGKISRPAEQVELAALRTK